MKALLPILLFLLGSAALGRELAPNAKLTLEFPDLPNTLAGMVSGTEKLARLGAILPSNYSSETKHPLFVYLKGGSGGPDDEGEMARDIVGGDDFIAVQIEVAREAEPVICQIKL